MISMANFLRTSDYRGVGGNIFDFVASNTCHTLIVQEQAFINSPRIEFFGWVAAQPGILEVADCGTVDAVGVNTCGGDWLHLYALGLRRRCRILM